MYNQSQRYLFLSLLDKHYGHELTYLKPVLNRLKKGLSQKIQLHIKNKIKDIPIKGDLLLQSLIFILHLDSTKDGYLSMLTKELIDKTDIVFEEENITNIHEELKETLETSGLPKQKINLSLIKNITFYSPEFKKKYPNLN